MTGNAYDRSSIKTVFERALPEAIYFAIVDVEIEYSLEKGMLLATVSFDNGWVAPPIELEANIHGIVETEDYGDWLAECLMRVA